MLGVRTHLEIPVEKSIEIDSLCVDVAKYDAYNRNAILEAVSIGF